MGEVEVVDGEDCDGEVVGREGEGTVEGGCEGGFSGALNTGEADYKGRRVDGGVDFAVERSVSGEEGEEGVDDGEVSVVRGRLRLGCHLVIEVW